MLGLLALSGLYDCVFCSHVALSRPHVELTPAQKKLLRVGTGPGLSPSQPFTLNQRRLLSFSSAESGYDTVNTPTPFGVPLHQPLSSSSLSQISPLALLTPSVRREPFLLCYSCLFLLFSLSPSPPSSSAILRLTSPLVLRTLHKALTPHLHTLPVCLYVTVGLNFTWKFVNVIKTQKQNFVTALPYLREKKIENNFTDCYPLWVYGIRVCMLFPLNTILPLSLMIGSGGVISSQQALESYLSSETERELGLTPDLSWPPRPSPDTPSTLRKYHVATR